MQLNPCSGGLAVGRGDRACARARDPLAKAGQRGRGSVCGAPAVRFLLRWHGNRGRAAVDDERGQHIWTGCDESNTRPDDSPLAGLGDVIFEVQRVAAEVVLAGRTGIAAIDGLDGGDCGRIKRGK